MDKIRIMLDMDGVLCDYDTRIDKLNGRKANGKSNWEYLAQIGSTFWSEMEWMPEGKKLYTKLLEYIQDKENVELGILSAIFLKCGKQGKIEWLKNNCPEIPEKNIIICEKGCMKYEHADNNSILVDDTEENVLLYEEYGPAILFINAEQAFNDIKKMIES